MKDSSPPPHFTKGTPIEVSSSEDGLGGVWFEATVITLPPSSSKKKKPPTQNSKLYIEYKSLCSDENLSSPLREHVDVLYVRPVPPIQENPTVFELYDVVDAFFKDGWWVGVITRVFEEGVRFLVTFQNPVDEIEFGVELLRLHLDWIDNAWVRPPKQKLTGLIFGEGKEVEVLIKIKLNQYVWYPATVVENHDDSSFLVEYKVLKEGTNEAEAQKASVDCSQIRPSPPPLKGRCYDLLEKVDAFHECGWWAGLVTKELPDNRYTVFFQSMKREREFDHIDLRPQLNWKDGKWCFISSQEEVTKFQENNGGPVGNENNGGPVGNENNGVPVGNENNGGPVGNENENKGGPVGSEIKDTSSGRTFKTKVYLKGKKMAGKARISSSSRESDPSEILSDSLCTPKGVLMGTNLEETKVLFPSLGTNQSDHVALDQAKFHGVASFAKKAKRSMKVPTQLAEKLKRGGGAVTPSRTLSQQTAAMVDEQNGRISSTSGSPPSNIPGVNMLIDLNSEYEPSDNPSPGKKTPKRRKKIDSKENHANSSRRKRGQADEEGNGFTKDAELVELDSGGEKAGSPYILGLECSKSSGSKARKTTLSQAEEFPKLEGDQKKQPDDLVVQEKGDQSEAGKSSTKRKRGRPRKVSVGIVNAGLTEQNIVPVNGDIIIKDSTTSEVDSHVARAPMLSMGGLLPAESSLMSVSDSMKLVDARLNCRNDSASTMTKSSSSVGGLLPPESSLMPVSTDLVVAQSNCTNHLTSTIRQSSPRTPTASNDQALISDHERQMYVQEKRRTSENNISQISDSSDGTVVKIAEPFYIRDVVRTVQREPGMLDDQPLSTWFEKKPTSAPGASPAMMVENSIEIRQTSKEVNGTDIAMSEDVDSQSRVLVDSDTILKQCVELRQTGKDPNGQTTSAKEVDERSGVLVDGDTSGPELPFVKQSPIWKAIESLEAFHRMPQKPHFRPLKQYKESSREGLAIGYMVNFASAVEKISMLRLEDAKEKIDDILESLKDLESHGFQVQVLQDRITEFESIKEKYTELQEEVEVINKKIVSCKFAQFDQDNIIREATNQIKKLQERIAKAESIKETKDRELAVWESRRQEAEETIESSQSCYEGLASGVLRPS